MTIASLNCEIDAASAEFGRLGGRHWCKRLDLEAQKLSVKQAELLARLYKFRSMIAAKEYSLGVQSDAEAAGQLGPHPF